MSTKSGYTEWQLGLYNTRTGLIIDDDTGKCSVLTANSPVALTIYSDDAGTSKTNPATFSNGIVRFWTADTVTSLDLSVMTAKGQSYFMEDVTPSMHRIDVDPDQRRFTLVASLDPSATPNTDTGFDFPAQCLIRPEDVHLYVSTAIGTAGRRVSIGILATETGGDADGFMKSVNCETTGNKSVLPSTAQKTIGGSTADTYITGNSNGSPGALVATVDYGVATLSADSGGYAPKQYVTDGTAKSLAYMTIDTTVAGYIFVSYEKLPSLS